MDVLYVLEPKSTSGARYQSVTTLWGVQISLYAIYGKYNSTHLVRESVDWYTERPCQTKISQLQLSFPIDQQILGFQITMKDPILVAKCGTLEELVHETPDGDRIEGAPVAMDVHVFLEIALAVFEDQDELGLGMNHVVQTDDVDVLELLHE